MKRHCSAALGALALLAAHAAAGQTASTAAPAAAPKSDSWGAIAKLPDWGGLWELTFVGRGGGAAAARTAEQPALTPPYAAKLAEYRAAQQRGEIEDTPAANCVPPGMPGVMTQPYPIEFLFTPGKITILVEAYSQWRQIFTDGRKHPDDPDLTFNGHSIGHWEGDTLVVDTVGFTTDTRLGNYGIQHSDKMHIVERMHLAAPDRLEIETTITDPEALEKPYTTSRVYGRHRDWTLAEYVCQQNNRNGLTDAGKSTIDLSTHEVNQ